MMKRLFWSFACLCLIVGFSCSKAEKEPQESVEKKPDKNPVLRPIDETTENILYNYIDEQGNFHAVEKADEVPDAFRNDVVVIDLNLSPEERGSADSVVVADLERLDERGHFTLRVENRAKFDQAIKLKRKWKLNEAPKAFAQATPQQLQNVPLTPNTDQIILYSTAWCGYCKAARKWLKSHGVSFVEKDIEKDEQASIELQAKMTRAGQQTGGVPVIDWKGRLVPGFDKNVLEQLLKAGK